MNTAERQMLDLLKKGKNEFGVVAVKAEFEAEGTRVDELLRLLELARRADLKVALKIGGCEAMRDLIECRQYGVDYVIAPMVETDYALSKYAGAIDKVFPADERSQISFLFNVETHNTLRDIDAMGERAGKNGLGMVLGRVDFAGSLGKDRSFCNSDDMLVHVSRVAEIAKARGVEMVMGGGVSAEGAHFLKAVRAIKLDRFETRKIVFDGAMADSAAIGDALTNAAAFELLWLQNKRDFYRGLAAEDETRIAMMEKRQASNLASVA